MSIQAEINSRTSKLQAILAGANARITEKKGTAAATLDGLPNAIDSIKSEEAKLQVKGVTPTGSIITVRPDEGYDGLSAVNIAGDTELIPENIKSGVEIYGVTGTLEAESGGGGTELVTTAIDYSAWNNGVFKETLGSGDTLTYAVEFDADGQPNKITAPDGTVTWIEWGES